MSQHRIVMLGAPGSGKGTAATEMSVKLKTPTVSTGQMFREAIKAGGPVGLKAESFVKSGQLVPDDVVMEVVREWLMANKGNGFICDGFPRTVAQAEGFDKLLAQLGKPLTMVILLEVTVEEILERMLGRLVCEKCGASHHVTRLKPKVAGVCDKCSGKLVTLADDTEATIRDRMRVFNETTMPLADYYQRTGVLQRVDGSGLAAVANARVLALFD